MQECRITKRPIMSTLLTTDGTHLLYKDWGTGQPILFAYGWPLSSDAWDQQMLFFSQNGFRVIAHDRRSHGRSDQTFNGNHMNQYADDLAELIQALDLSNLILVGHSTGGGEVSHYIGRHGTARVAKVVLVGAVPPLMLKIIQMERPWTCSTISVRTQPRTARSSSSN